MNATTARDPDGVARLRQVAIERHRARVPEVLRKARARSPHVVPAPQFSPSPIGYNSRQGLDG
ncbi:hypothetical protein PUN4_1390010 [Paraburkholderia unamae]|nr:hypothetical protein PUN4_1390010 [Paraburkholderia unamae]